MRLNSSSVSTNTIVQAEINSSCSYAFKLRQKRDESLWLHYMLITGKKTNISKGRVILSSGIRFFLLVNTTYSKSLWLERADTYYKKHTTRVLNSWKIREWLYFHYYSKSSRYSVHHFKCITLGHMHNQCISGNFHCPLPERWRCSTSYCASCWDNNRTKYPRPVGSFTNAPSTALQEDDGIHAHV